jgi:hypothetical protein
MNEPVSPGIRRVKSSSTNLRLGLTSQPLRDRFPCPSIDSREAAEVTDVRRCDDDDELGHSRSPFKSSERVGSALVGAGLVGNLTDGCRSPNRGVPPCRSFLVVHQNPAARVSKCGADWRD